jgi:hypothetical protein
LPAWGAENRVMSIALSDEALDTLMHLAGPIEPALRDPFVRGRGRAGQASAGRDWRGLGLKDRPGIRARGPLTLHFGWMVPAVPRRARN